MVRTAFFIALTCLAMPVLALTKLTASVDKNPVLAGEYFAITIKADDTVNNSQPDTQALLDDFVVGPMSRSNQTRIINGAVSRQSTWQIELMAREAGNYEIPAFTINGVSSEPFTLKVVNNANSSLDDSTAFIKTELTPQSLYVQQAGVYTVKLYLGVDLIDGSLAAPSMENANITQMGKQRESQEVIDGRRYLVIQRDYLVQPQKSGTFELQAPRLNGKVRKNYRAMAVSASATNTLVDVKPMPEGINGTWLPSELVDLSEQWQGADEQVQVGTPITRTLTLTALNTTKEQLPDLTSPDLENVRSYPDQSERTHLIRDGRIIAQTTTSIAYVPQQPGTYTLPAIEVPWFNTVTGRAQIAKVAEKTITVVGEASTTAAPSPSDAPQTTATNDVSAPPTHSDVSLRWAIPGYVLWLLTMAAWWWQRQGTQTLAPTSTKPQPKTAKGNLQAVQRALKAQNPQELYRALDAHAKANKSSLHQWQSHWPEDARQELTKLRQQLYSHDERVVDYSLIAQGINTPVSMQQKQQTELDSLY